MSPDLKDIIRQQAEKLGFDGCGFSSAEGPQSFSMFKQWLDAGMQAEMGWMARSTEKRADPTLLLPEAQSCVVLAVSYPSVISAKVENQSHCGSVARYARFNDYHDVLAERLNTLASFIDGLADSSAKSAWYLDTGPVLERDLAQRAGLGFIGKHTNLIGRRLGNWFFIAEILTPLKLVPDKPEINRCGTCSRCIQACPTNAIVSPFVLDARRCISYLTIENKGPIPVELRPLIGSRIFGCDDCLKACPWNRFAQAGEIMQEHRRPDLANPNLIELLGLNDIQFKARFSGSPLLRSRRRGLLRNVCVALGNSADPSALPALEKAAQDAEPLIREHAVWAIERLTRKNQI